MAHCTHCGQEASEAHRFCPNCGQPVAGGSAALSAPGPDPLPGAPAAGYLPGLPRPTPGAPEAAPARGALTAVAVSLVLVLAVAGLGGFYLVLRRAPNPPAPPPVAGTARPVVSTTRRVAPVELTPAPTATPPAESPTEAPTWAGEPLEEDVDEAVDGAGLSSEDDRASVESLAAKTCPTSCQSINVTLDGQWALVSTDGGSRGLFRKREYGWELMTWDPSMFQSFSVEMNPDEMKVYQYWLGE